MFVSYISKEERTELPYVCTSDESVKHKGDTGKAGENWLKNWEICEKMVQIVPMKPRKGT